MLSKRIKHHRIYILKMPRDYSQTISADRWGNRQLRNLNFLASNTYFSTFYSYEFCLTKCRKYWEDRRIKQKFFESKTTNIYPRFRSQWGVSRSRRVSFQFLLHFLNEPLYSCSRKTKPFNELTVSHIDKKGASLIRPWSSRETKQVRLWPPFCLALQHLRPPGNFTGGQELP